MFKLELRLGKLSAGFNQTLEKNVFFFNKIAMEVRFAGGESDLAKKPAPSLTKQEPLDRLLTMKIEFCY